MANLRKFFLIAMAVVGFSITANANDIFMAKNVYVDVTERNSEIARRHAMGQGQAVAFRRILERLVTKEDLPFLPEFSPEEISYLLKEVSIVKESTSPVRYIATLNISFDEEKTKQILTEMGITFVLSASRPYVLIPVYDKDGKPIVFEQNPWQSIWRYSAPESVLLPIKKLRFNSEDMLEIKSNHPTREQLIKIADRYGAEGVIIAEAIKVSDTEYKLAYRKYLNGYATQRYQRNFDIEDGNEKAALRRMANYIVNREDASWREKMAVNVSEPNLMVVVVPLRDLSHLNKVRERIGKIPLIASYELKAVKQDRAQINVWHSTNPKDLERAFSKQKMKLIKVADNVYGVQDLVPAPPKPKKIEPKPEENINGGAVGLPAAGVGVEPADGAGGDDVVDTKPAVGASGAGVGIVEGVANGQGVVGSAVTSSDLDEPVVTRTNKPN